MEVVVNLLLLALLACTGGDKGPTANDADGDGVEVGVDCNDDDAQVYPEAPERCNDADDDCDDEIDEGLAVTFYPDADGDTYGDASAPVEDCAQPTGTVTNGDDCDDTAITVNPGAAEVCDGLDNDCTGGVDDGVQVTLYLDADGDGYGVATKTSKGCEAGGGWALTEDDCDDADALTHPDADETDCTDITDRNCDGTATFIDGDGDGWATCADCDDEDATFSPDAIETCNDLDDDCDGEIDEAGATEGTDWYLDNDGDGYGDSDTTTNACDQPEGYAGSGGDCNDDQYGINPAIPEICDGLDDDCDGYIDEVC